MAKVNAGRFAELPVELRDLIYKFTVTRDFRLDALDDHSAQ